MTVTERSRHDLFTALEDHLGAAEAETMMELLPSTGWSDVARAGDLARVERSINERITTEGALLRAEMAELRAELRAEFTTAFATFRDELHRDQRTLQRQIILALVVALIGLLVSAAGLG